MAELSGKVKGLVESTFTGKDKEDVLKKLEQLTGEHKLANIIPEKAEKKFDKVMKKEDVYKDNGHWLIQSLPCARDKKVLKKAEEIVEVAIKEAIANHPDFWGFYKSR